MSGYRSGPWKSRKVSCSNGCRHFGGVAKEWDGSLARRIQSPSGPKTVWRLAHVLDARLDLSQSPIEIPERFQQVRYDHERYPGAPRVSVLGGAQTASNTPTNLCVRSAMRFLTSDPVICGQIPLILSFPGGRIRSTWCSCTPRLSPGVHMWGSI